MEIERIYVSRELQGKCLGNYLMDRAIVMAAGRKKQYVWLGVWEKTEKAHFYKKHGFCKTGTHVFLMDGDAQTDYIMRRDLVLNPVCRALYVGF